jgi:hypothetical protein
MSHDTIHPLFQFADEPPSRSAEGAYVVDVPSDERDVIRFLGQLGRLLQFPNYYGQNWNALEDCLRDLAWIAEERVILWHRKLPSLPDEELRVYLAVVRHSIQDWRPGEAHQLIAVFPASSRGRVESLLQPPAKQTRASS